MPLNKEFHIIYFHWIGIHYIWLAHKSGNLNLKGVSWNFIKFEIKKRSAEKWKASIDRSRVFESRILFDLFLRNYNLTQHTWKVVHNLIFMIWFHQFWGVSLGSINYPGWESRFSIRPIKVFKISSTQFQWTQTSERDLVERQHMQWF